MVAVAIASALGLTGCVTKDGSGGAAPLGAATDPPHRAAGMFGEPGWTRVADVPLSARTEASVVTVDNHLFVFGGWTFACPPGADCRIPTERPFADGAALDLTTGAWTPIATAPVGIRTADTAVLGGDVYLFSRCAPDESCPAGGSLLRYRTFDDEWDQFPAPADTAHSRITTLSEGVVAYSTSDEVGEQTDYRFDAASPQWSPLPDDPLPPAYDRRAIAHEGRLLVFGSVIGGPATKLGAVLDPTTQAWTSLPGSGTQGFQVWRSGERAYLNPHSRTGTEGGVFDLTSRRWSPLPVAPDSPNWSRDMAGVIGADDAVYESPSGWVLRTTDDTWLEVPVRPGGTGVVDSAEGSAGTSLAVFGGQRSTGLDGELLDELWLWNPPMSPAPSSGR